MMNEQLRHAWLLESLQLIAAEADVQIDLLEPGDVTDEIAASWEYAYVDLSGWSSANLIGPDVASRLQALDAFMEAMSGSHQSELWTDEALRKLPQWQQLRVMAREILADLGVPQAIPYQGPMYVDDALTRLLTAEERAQRAAFRLAELRARRQ